jgi:hypothetical protein
MVIIEETGERLRAVVREDPEVPTSLRKQIDRLRQPLKLGGVSHAADAKV